MTEYKNSVHEIFAAGIKLIEQGCQNQERVDVMNASDELLASLTSLREIYNQELLDGEELAKQKAETNANYIRLEYCIMAWDSAYRNIYRARMKVRTLPDNCRTVLFTNGFYKHYGCDQSVHLCRRLTRERLYSKQATYEPDYDLIKAGEEVLRRYESERNEKAVTIT